MRHRDRTGELPAISDDNAPLPPAHRPTRWTVRRGRSIAFALVGLAVAASLASVYLTYKAAQQSAAQAAAVDRRLSVLEQDLADRTRQRDAERDAAVQEQARFRDYLCGVLGQLSADNRGLDQIRATLGCTQPGVATSTPSADRTPRPPVVGRAAPAPAGDAAAAPTRPAPPPPQDGPSPSPASSPAPTGRSTPRPSPSLLCGLLPPLC